MARVFNYEASFADDLAFMPMAVRYALDTIGRTISLADWIALPFAARRDLVARACDETHVAFAESLDASLAAAALPHARHATPFDRDALVRPSETLGEDVDDATWSRLAPFERYALVKLGDRAEPSHNFAAALDELGVRSVGVGGGRVDAAAQGEVVTEHDA